MDPNARSTCKELLEHAYFDRYYSPMLHEPNRPRQRTGSGTQSEITHPKRIKMFSYREELDHMNDVGINSSSSVTIGPGGRGRRKVRPKVKPGINSYSYLHHVSFPVSSQSGIIKPDFFSFLSKKQNYENNR